MGPSEGKGTGIGVAAVVAAIVTTTTGAVSLIDAADTWQDVLDRVRSAYGGRSGAGCAGQFTVSGFGDIPVLVLLGIALLALGLSLKGIQRGLRWNGVGVVAGFATAAVSALLWLDAYGVSRSQIGDCDGIGLSGAASAAVTRAGWLLFLSLLLSLLTASWFQHRTGEWFH